jgi:hypothetical protein
MASTKNTKLTKFPKFTNLPNKKSQTFNGIDLATCTTQFLVRRG